MKKNYKFIDGILFSWIKEFVRPRERPLKGSKAQARTKPVKKAYIRKRKRPEGGPCGFELSSACDTSRCFVTLLFIFIFPFVSFCFSLQSRFRVSALSVSLSCKCCRLKVAFRLRHSLMAVWGDDPSLSNQQSRFQSDTRNPSLNPFFPSSQRKPHLFPFFSCPMNDSSFVSDTRTHCHSDDRQSAFVKLPVSSFLSDHLIFFFFPSFCSFLHAIYCFML